MRATMRKFFVVGLVLVGMTVAAQSAHAQTQAELLNSIAALKALVNSLQAQLNAAGIATTDSNTTSDTAVSIQEGTTCPKIVRDLKRGSQDSNTDYSVSELQRFLIGTGDLATSATGIFGPATENAVKKFQCRELGICSGSPSTNGYGVVGKQTRAKMTMRCATNTGATTNSTNTTTAPSFSTSQPYVPAATCKAWFDGCNSCIRDKVGGPAVCTERMCTTYASGYCTETSSSSSGGVCTQDLKKCSDGTWVGRTPPSCNFMCPSTPTSPPSSPSTPDTSGAASPGSVDGGNGVQQIPPPTAICTQEYAPVCAIPPGCANTGGSGVATMLCQQQEPKTYSNACTAKAALANVVYTGACVSKPIISGVSGPTKLSVGQTGTWTFAASGAGDLEQSIEIWGTQASSGFVSTGIITSQVGSSIAYAFTAKGTYQINFTAKVSTGSQVPGGQPIATKSITVVVE